MVPLKVWVRRRFGFARFPSFDLVEPGIPRFLFDLIRSRFVPLFRKSALSTFARQFKNREFIKNGETFSRFILECNLPLI